MGNIEEKRPADERLGVYVTLRKYDERIRIGFIWLRIGTHGSLP
jgi:hypothetical protein